MFIVPVTTPLEGPWYHVTREADVADIQQRGLDWRGRGSGPGHVYLTRAEFLAWWLHELPEWHETQGAAPASEWTALEVTLDARGQAHMDRAARLPNGVTRLAECRVADSYSRGSLPSIFPLPVAARALTRAEAEAHCHTALRSWYAEILEAEATQKDLSESDDYIRLMARWASEFADRTAAPLAFLPALGSPTLLANSATAARLASHLWRRAGDPDLAAALDDRAREAGRRSRSRSHDERAIGASLDGGLLRRLVR